MISRNITELRQLYVKFVYGHASDALTENDAVWIAAPRRE